MSADAMSDRFNELLAIDARLVRAGVQPIAPWWNRQLRRWYASRARRFVGRVGRGGIKSHSTGKVGLAEVPCGTWQVPPGERHFFAYVSQNKAEATQRLSLLQSFLRILGVEFDAAGDEIALRDLPLGFRVFGCQIGAVSGFRCIGFAADEVAKWESADSHRNPAPEVLASLRAMTVTHPEAREFIVSSAFGVLDAHHALVEQGDTDSQIVAVATSWEANPAISKEATREIESDERRWLREYASIPQAEVSAAWPPDVIAEAFNLPDPSQHRLSEPCGIEDPSSGRRDAWTSAVARVYLPRPVSQHLTRPGCLPGSIRDRFGALVTFAVPQLDQDGRPVPNPGYSAEPRPPLLVIEHVEGIAGAFWRGLSAAEHVKQRAAMYRARGVRLVFGDQREGYSLPSLYSAHGIRYVPIAWTAESKPRAIERVRRWFAERTIRLCPCEPLRRELLSFRERIMPSGHVTFEGRETDDYVALVITLAHAELAGYVPHSPLSARTVPITWLPPA